MPVIELVGPTNQMRWGVSTITPISGSSFAAPAILAVAIQAQQFEGWFSALAFPMVNKAVLLAGTRDANADGAIGKGNKWSSQPSDAEDGAGQINYAYVSDTLNNNRYYWTDLADSNFVSCGTNCRTYVVTSISIPYTVTARVALAWQSCMTTEAGGATLNNDLDLALNCGSHATCAQTTLSDTVTSELEMLERPACGIRTADRVCSIEIRIKNGAALASCGSTTTERVGVAWSLH
ncbi:MAG: hypothetical protein JWO36_6483 [Myxococcales bacterium]|nr:hypothetical protein [Myxococcales bacterium]